MLSYSGLLRFVARLPLWALPVLMPGRTPLAGQEARPSLAEPGVSPDGREIAFVAGGDIWTVPETGGTASLLVAHEAEESRPLYSPMGDLLAFTSDRTGGGDVYLLALSTGELRRLTYGDSRDEVSGWSADGQWLYFSATDQDVNGMSDVFRVRAQGGTPMPVLADRYEGEFFATPSPDGRHVALATRGRMAYSQWWRNGHSHIDEAEIWIATTEPTPTYRQFSPGEGKEIWPLWSPDGETIYYMSDRSGAENLWKQAVGGGEPEALTRFSKGRVLWPSISADGSVIVFERNFGIWTLDPATGQAAQVPVRLRGVAQAPAIEYETFANRLGEMALSPDGKKVAFVVHGEIFASSSEDGGTASRVTRTPAGESEVAWSPDSRALVYTSRRDEEPQLYLFDFSSGEERRLTSGDEAALSPVFSPDGTRIVYVRGGQELRVLTLDGQEDRPLARGVFWLQPLSNDRSIAWSPDGEWLAYTAVSGPFTNIHVVSASGGDPRPVSFLANASAGSISWSPDGTYLLFSTGQRTEDGMVARVDLIPRTPEFREDHFDKLFQEEGGARSPKRGIGESSTPAFQAGDSVPLTRIEFENIRLRSSFVPLEVSAGEQVISPDGKWLLISASAEGRQNLYLYPLEELSTEPRVAKQLTSTSGRKSHAQFSPDSKKIFYLESGRIRTVGLDGGSGSSVSVQAEMEVDFQEEKRQVFDEAWSFMRDQFYDADYHGADWDAVRTRWEPQIAGARNPHDLHRLINLMLGELNASHSGNRASGGDSGPGSGYLGLRFQRGRYETDGRLQIAEVTTLGPADVTGEIHPGDYVMSVDGNPVDAGTNYRSLLEGRVGDRVELEVSSTEDPNQARTVVVKPASAGAVGRLRYRDWVESRRAYVAEVSGGRLGYVHMPDMGWESLQQLFLDLDAENRSREGVVVDIRNNNGGFVNVYAIDVLAREGYLTMTIRGGPPTPARTTLGQRALEKPTVLVINQHTLSDGEDFTEGYRELDLGTVVGEPTAGWIIYTWGTSLIDGSSLRLPRTRVEDNRGQTMELHPRPVDLEVVRPAGESYQGEDSQLREAVRVLLEQLDGEGS